MSVLSSRPLPGAFNFYDGLQLGAGITYAEESFRKTLMHVLGENTAIIRREIILPNKKNRPKTLPSDSSGYIMKSDLAEGIARAKWDQLTSKQQNEIYSLENMRYQVEKDDDFDTRVVFFRAMVRTGEELPKLVVAKVQIFAISNWWNFAAIQIWHRPYHYIGAYGEPMFKGSQFQIDSHVFCIVEEKDWQPPEFLKAE